MKILHIIQRYPPAVGGSETWCLEISRYLASVGDEVKVLTLNVLEEEEYWQDPPTQARTMQLGKIDWDGQVLVRRYKRALPIPTLHHMLFERFLDRMLDIHFYGPHSIEMYGKMFSEVKVADVVHLHTIPYPHNFVGFLAAKLFRKRVVITPYFHSGHSHYERWCNYWLLRRCNAIFALSDYEREYLASRAIDPAKIIVTGSGLRMEDYVPKDLDRFRKDLLERYRLSADTGIVLFVGRKTEYKGLPILIEAVKRVMNKYDVALFLVGPSLDWFRNFYAQMSEEAKQKIFDLGQISHQEKVNLLHLAKALVLPSPYESFGIVFLEAWACGTPVIGTDNRTIADVIEGGGLTFQSGNAEDLADKIEVLLKDNQLGEEMVRHGREKIVQKYGWDKIGAVVRKAYRPRRDGTMRILICSNLFPPHSVGGSEVVAYKQAKVLKGLGHEVRIFCGRLASNLVHPYRIKVEKGEFHTTWIDLSPQDLGGLTQSLLNEKIRRGFGRVLEEFFPDIVHFHNITGLSMQVVDECHERGIPSVMTLHDYWGICFKNLMLKNDGSLCMKGGFDCLGCLEVLSGDPPLPSPVRNAHILLALRKVDRFISPSQYLAERFIANGIPAERVAVIRNGIDLDSFQRAVRRNNRFTLGYVGQLMKHKGVEFLLRSLSLLEDFEKPHIIIVGDGEEARSLRSLCRELNLDRSVAFYGRVDNQHIAAIHKQIDVLVVPSVWPENSPVTITEAMASGVPVIASDIGGIRELVEDGVTGFLVPPKDVKALSQRISYLIHHPDVRQRMGEKAAEKIKEHELRNQVNLVFKVYQELLDPGRSGTDPDLDVLLYHADGHWDSHVREVLYQLSDVERNLGRRLLLCHLGLSDEETIRSAKLLLIPSASPNSFLHALHAFRRGLPILVHENAWELKELCLASNAGLFYANPEELQECLVLLLSNEPLRKAMGANGRKCIENQVAQFGVPQSAPKEVDRGSSGAKS